MSVDAAPRCAALVRSTDGALPWSLAALLQCRTTALNVCTGCEPLRQDRTKAYWTMLPEAFHVLVKASPTGSLPADLRFLLNQYFRPDEDDKKKCKMPTADELKQIVLKWMESEGELRG